MDRKRKRELRELNNRAWVGEIDIFSVNSSLDSALKKNTAFIKRLRTGITASSLNTFITEIRTLSLHKYLSEIISACFEGLCKLKTPGEIAAGIEICSALHQRFGPDEFTKQIGWLVGRGLSTPDKSQLKGLSQDVREREEKDRLARHRVLLKVVTELWLVAFLRSLDDVERPEEAGAKGKEGPAGSVKADSLTKSKVAKVDSDGDAEPFPLEVLKDLLGHDREHNNLPLAVLFVKNYSWDVLGIKSVDDGRKTVEADGATVQEVKEDLDGDATSPSSEIPADDQPLISEKLQTRFKNILARYLEDVKAHVLRDQKQLSNQNRKNAEAYVKSGEIFEDRQANFEKQSKAHEKLVSNCQILCEALGVDMPDLAEKEATDGLTSNSIGLVKAGEYLRGQGDGAGIWEDEEERRFYENLADLKGKVPGVLLEDGKKKKADGEEQVKKADGDATESSESKAAEADDQSTAIVNKTVGAQLDALLAGLPDLQTKDQVDQMALDFCFLNSKASRNRLVKAVQETPKGRSDLLPLYSRLVATLGQHMSDVTQGLITYLDDEFRSLQRRKQKEFLGQVRTNNIRYLAELTKFGVVPEHVIFHCFKVSLDDFSRMNIDIIGNLLENCGRYLLRNPETSPRMVSFLETLGRKKAAQHLGSQERMILENAMYYVDPPQRPAVQQKERSPIDLFVRKLLYLDMTKRNYTRILKSIRKLHWEEQEVVDILETIFSKPGKVKYGNIHLLAILASALYRYHQSFIICVVDNVLENITLGLEQNDFKFNQRRISEVKYLGELYNYKMVDSPVIFDTLYRIVTFGHEGGTPRPENINYLDLPDDFFRIRLVAQILDTCGVCFDRGAAKKKMDFFLTFFQYYIFTKTPLPMDIEFVVQDTFALVRPQWKIAADLTEAAGIFAEACANNYKASEADKAAEVEEDPDEISSNDGLDDGNGPDIDDGDSAESSDEIEAVNNDEEEHERSESEEEQIFVTREEEKIDPEAEADFDRAFESMMNDSMQSRKFERKTLFDVPLPMRRAPVRESTPGVPEETDNQHEQIATSPPKTMAFSLMTKRGNRQQTRPIDLPSDSNFAIAMKTQQQAEREEQQRIKNLVLKYDLRDDNDQENGEFISLPSSYGPLSTRNPNTKGDSGLERQHPSHSRIDKSSNTRSGQRARKLQMSDVDWYDSTSRSSRKFSSSKPSGPASQNNFQGPFSRKGERTG